MADAAAPIAAPLAAAPPPPAAPPAAPVASETVSALPSRAERIRAIAERHAGAELDISAPAASPAASAPTTTTIAVEAPASPAAASSESAEPSDRRRVLDALRADRRARASEKRAKDSIARADAFDAARTDWQRDPTRVLAAAGIDDRAFMQALIQRTLDGGTLDGGQAPPPDPVQAKVDAAVAPYVQALESERLNRETAHLVATKILPHVDAEKHEALIQFCGGNPHTAALAVKNELERHFNATGELVHPADALAQMDAQCDAKLREATTILRGTKRYGALFAQAVAEAVAEVVGAQKGAPAKAAPVRALTRTGAPTREAAPTPRPANKADRIRLALERAAKTG